MKRKEEEKRYVSIHDPKEVHLVFQRRTKSGEERGGTDDIPQVYDTTDIRLAIEVLQLS